MDKKPLIGGCICAVVLLVLSSLSNVVGYQSGNTNTEISENGLRDDNDTTPPVTTISFDPPVPNGLNGWYVSNVTVTLNATDNESGVRKTFCSLSPGGNYTEPILVSQDGEYHIVFYSIDYAGNVEVIKSALLKIDKTPPTITMNYTVKGNPWSGYVIIITVTAIDYMSGMNRVEFYYNELLQETMIGLGPEYVWQCICPQITVRGLIRHLEITDDYVKFYAVIVRINNLWDLLFNSIDTKAYAYDDAGNWIWDRIEHPSSPVFVTPGFYFFQNVTLPNNYTGYIGRFFIMATFHNLSEG